MRRIHKTVKELWIMIQSNLQKINNLQRVGGNDLFVIYMEIDTEIIERLDEVAGAAKEDLTWSKTLPVNKIAA